MGFPMHAARRSRLERRNWWPSRCRFRTYARPLKQTQVRVARELGIKQENVSRIEKRTDLLISTLNGYVEAMGGRLRLVAEFSGRPPVSLTGIGMVDDAQRSPK